MCSLSSHNKLEIELLTKMFGLILDAVLDSIWGNKVD